MNDILYLILIIITFFLIFICINKFLKKDIENYGIYCGRYNINPSTAQYGCKNDHECNWNEYTSQSGTSAGWCGQGIHSS
jgi:hypothetical protein